MQKDASKKKLSKYSLMLIVIINVLLVLSFLFFSQVAFPTVSVKKISRYNREYTLLPIYNHNFISPLSTKYPFIRVPPWDFRYIFVPPRESRKIQSKKYDNFFYAEKRIAELLEWGNVMPIAGNHDERLKDVVFSEDKSKTILLLKKHWNDQKRKNYNSWEAALARYTEHIENKEKELISQVADDRIDRSKEIVVLLSRLKTHHSDLETYINTIGKSEKQKKYLLRLNDVINEYLNKRISFILPPYNSYASFYPLSDVVREKEYGTYNVFIENISGAADFKDKIYLGVKEKIHPPAYTDKNENEIVYANIRIGPSNKFSIFKDLSLKIPQANSTANNLWEKIENTDASYYTDFNNAHNHRTFYLKFKSSVRNFFRLKLEKTYKGRDTDGKLIHRADIYLDQPFNATPVKVGEGIHSFESLIQLRDEREKSSTLNFILESSIPLSLEERQSTSVELVPVYDIPITLKRVPELSPHNPVIKNSKPNIIINRVSFKNSSLTEEMYVINTLKSRWHMLADEKVNRISGVTRESTFIYRPLFFMLSVWFFVNVFFLTFLMLRAPMNIFYTVNLSFISISLKKIKQIFRKYFFFTKYALPIILLPALLYDIFWLKSYSDLILLFVTFCWMGIILVYRLDSRSSFFLGLLWLIIMPHFAHINNGNIAEKLGIWSFAFLLIGSMQSVIELKHPSRKIYRLPVLIKKTVLFAFILQLGNFINVLFNRIGQLLISFFRLLKYYAKLTFYRPRNLRDFLLIVIKSLLILISFLIVIFISAKVYFFIEKTQRIHTEDRIRVSMNPRIIKIEPRIAYHSSKVIIFGENFGWKEHHRVRLLRNGENVSTITWTDTKITFSIPLHWKSGLGDLWIEKEIEWKGKPEVAKSKSVKLQLLPTTNKFTKDDDEYFRQLGTLEDETLLLNNYDPKDYK